MFLTVQGELEHRRAKRFYPRTDRKKHMGQIAQHTRRERILEAIHLREHRLRREAERRARIAHRDNLPAPSSSHPVPPVRKRGRPRTRDRLLHPSEPIPFDLHHQLSNSQRDYFNMLEFVHRAKDDPALEVSTNEYYLRIQLISVRTDFYPTAENSSHWPTIRENIHRRRR